MTSKVVISKETPLHDPVKAFEAAAEDAIVPDRRGGAIGEIARRPNLHSATFRELSRWVNSDEAELNGSDSRGNAHLYQDLRQSDPEFADRIVRFWSGDPIGVGEIKRRLREAGEAAPRASRKCRFVISLCSASGSAPRSSWLRVQRLDSPARRGGTLPVFGASAGQEQDD